MISALSLGLSPPVSTHQRRHAFERVYAEGRWIAGADGAGCKSGWSDVGAGQGSAALRALESVVGRYSSNSISRLTKVVARKRRRAA